jgi:hypothetical protein
VRSVWSTELNGLKVEVTSTIKLFGEFEARTHQLKFSASEKHRELEILEGSYALGHANEPSVKENRGPNWLALSSQDTRHLLVSWNLAGYDQIDRLDKFPNQKESTANLVSRAMSIISLSRKLRLPHAGALTLRSLHYASPKPMNFAAVQRKATSIVAAEVTML